MIYNLFKALSVMKNKDPNDPKQPKMSTYIGRRVLTSVIIVLILLLGILTGVITPNPRPY